MFKRIAQSSFLLLLLILFLVDCGVRYAKPLRYMEMGGYVPSDQNPLADKFDALRSEAHKTKILLLGSSLPMFAAVCADYRMGELTTPTIGYDACTYTKAKYLEDLLKTMVGADLPVFNYCGNGCMASDAYVAVEGSIKNGMKPKVVILALAPRDFIDNFALPTKETSYFDFFQKQRGDDKHFNLATLNIEDVFNKSLADVWSYYKLRPDYHTFFSLAASDSLHRAPTLYSATHRNPLEPDAVQLKLMAFGAFKLADVTGDEEKKRKCLESYNRCYNPINLRRFNAERDYLRKTLAYCRQHNILPVVVNMPRTARNQAILPPWFQAQYLSTLTDTCKQFDCPFYDLNKEPIFTEADYRDSVHLNGDGGLKVFNLLAAQLSKDENFLTAIEDKQQLSQQ